MKLFIQAISDIGCVRSKNEDMILIGNEYLRDTLKNYEFDFDSSEHSFLVAVADGMGGHKGGGYASEIVLNKMNEAIKELNKNLNFDSLKNHLAEKIKAIHGHLLEESSKDKEKEGMGSTFTGILFYTNKFYLINVGDSRIYRFRDGILSQLSRDHSLSEISGDPNAPKNVILNSFGAGQKIFIDFEDISERIITDDTLLLCSDGLSGELSDEEIEKILTMPENYSVLVDEAKKRGAKDNVSVIVMKYTEN
jgi:protein phosphatase